MGYVFPNIILLWKEDIFLEECHYVKMDLLLVKALYHFQGAR